MYDVLTSSIIQRTGGIIDIYNGTGKGIEALDKLYIKYAEDYEKNTGERFDMDRAAFNDMIINHLRNQVQELGYLLSMTSAMFALGFVQPPDDDKRQKAGIALLTKTTDKFVQELSFFYNPVNYEALLSGSLFPAIGLVTDIEKFSSNLFTEVTGYSFSKPTLSPSEIREKNYVVKYGLKLFPVASPWIQFTTVFSPDLAKELGIEMPSTQHQY